MKKVVLFLVLLVSFKGFSQPIVNRASSNNTVADGRLQATLNFYLPRFLDTASANSASSPNNIGIDSLGAQIFTYDVMGTWVRTKDVNGVKKWIQTSAGGSVGSGTWIVSGNGQNIVNSLNTGGLGTSNNASVSFITNGQIRAVVPAAGFQRQVTTGLFKYLVWDTTNHTIGYSDGGSSSTPTWQQTLTAGSTLTTNNIIDATNHSFEWSNIRGYVITSDDDIVNATTNSASNSSTTISLNSISIKPHLGNLNIDTLANLSTQNQLMGWTSTSGGDRGEVGYVTIGTGLTLSGGALSASPSGLTMPINNLLAATGANSINNGNFTQTWNWPTLTSGALLINAASTTMTNSSYVFAVTTSGNNASSGMETRAAEFQNTHTGTTSTNVALKLTASGGTVNNALEISNGALTLSGSAGTSGQVLTSAGANTLPTWSTPSTVATAVPWSGITNPTADLALTFDAGESTTFTNSNTTEDLLTMNSSTMTTSSMLSLNSTSTALASGNNLAEFIMSGANGTNAITATALRAQVTNTNATSGTNIGIQANASGATTNNWAIFTGTSTGADGRININNATNIANQVGIFKSLTNTATDGIAIRALNETATMQIGYQTISTTGEMNIAPGTFVLNLGGGATATTTKFFEPSGSGTNYTSIKAGIQAGNADYIWPTAVPAVDGYVLSSTIAGQWSWIAPATGTITGVTTFGSTPNANGLSVSGANILMQPADGSNPGGVSTTTQTFAGVKSMTSPAITTSITTPSTSFDLVNTTATTGNLFGAATSLTIGATTGTASIRNATVSFPTSGGVINFGGGAAVSETRWLEPSGAGTNYVGFKSPATLAGNTVYTLPNAFPAGTYLLNSTSAGVLGFTDPSTLGTIGGSIAANQVAYGSGANAIQGSDNFAYDGVTIYSIINSDDEGINNLYIKNNNSDGYAKMYFENNSSNGFFRFKGGTEFRIQGANNEPILLNPDGGFVGINTATPTVALDVVGDVQTLNSSGAGLLVSGSGVVFGDINGSFNNTYVSVNDGSSTIGINATTRIDLGSSEVRASSLAGTGSRAVLADASGALSAPVSDITTKQNVKDINGAIGKIMQLRPVTFEYRNEFKNYGKGTQVGFIAQEVEKVLPNSVYTNFSNGKMGYNEIDIVPLLVSAMQEQQKEIDDLKKEISKLKNKNK